MKRCPITYEELSEAEVYSNSGLKLLGSTLTALKPLNLSAKEQRAEAIARVGKMSLQGVQPKLSARLKVKEECFEIVDQFGEFILKPQSEYYPELPENEALTMSLAAKCGIEVPLHGLVYSKDASLTYFIKRFDRLPRKNKLAVEDFAQLSQKSRDTKYSSSMERVAKTIKEYCSFPKIESQKLFKLILFNFLIGNEDMHLKNFSLITRKNITTLSPAYDLLNTTIAQPNAQEELALPLKGKKHNLTRKDFFDYYANEQLGLNEKSIAKVMQEIKTRLPEWEMLIINSFLSNALKNQYIKLLKSRLQIVKL